MLRPCRSVTLPRRYSFVACLLREPAAGRRNGQHHSVRIMHRAAVPCPAGRLLKQRGASGASGPFLRAPGAAAGPDLLPQVGDVQEEHLLCCMCL